MKIKNEFVGHNFAHDDKSIRRFRSFSKLKKTYPNAPLSKTFQCPTCGKHKTFKNDILLAQSKLLQLYNHRDRFYWFEVNICDKCKEIYINKNQNYLNETKKQN